MRNGMRAGLAAALVLGGLGPSVTAPPAAQAGAACAVGEWDSVDIQTYFASMMAPVTAIRNPQVAGSMHFTFTDSGRFGEGINNVVVTAETDTGAWVQTMGGQIRGDYIETAPGMLTFSNFGASNVNTSVAIDGQVFMNSADLSSLAMDQDSSQMAFQCDGDRLLLTP